MRRDEDRPAWKGQAPWFEIWSAVVLDAERRRALWLRQTFFVPPQGPGRAKIWGAWFDAAAAEPTRAVKRHAAIEDVHLGEADTLIRIFDATLTMHSAVGAVEDLAWDLRWHGGRAAEAEVPAWLPSPAHARTLVHDAEASGHVTIAGTQIPLTGRVSATHQWGKRRVPTAQWLWAPWLGDSSLQVHAVSLRDTFSLGLASLRLDGPHPFHGRPATAALPSGLVTSTAAGARRLVHARGWAEPAQMVGYVYRDTDGRDLMVAQSDIGSAHYEQFTRTAPGAHWKLVDERRSAGGVAVEIHQHAALPDVDYISWEATTRVPREREPERALGNEEVAWPEVTAVVSLGLTYGDHGRETGQKLDPSGPPTSFTKHARALIRGDGSVRIPDSSELLESLEAAEPGLAAALRERLGLVPAAMDYEGEVALVALGAIDAAALGAGVPQPFGVAAANDLTSRFCQALGDTMASPQPYWTVAKSFPGFLPVAPRVWAPVGGIAKLPELTLETRVNGSVRQQASTKLVIYDLATMIRTAEAHLGRPLARGDVVLTGTPIGVGMRMSPLGRQVAKFVKERFRKAEHLVSTYATSAALLRPGDVIEVDAGPAGRVRTRLVV